MPGWLVLTSISVHILMQMWPLASAVWGLIGKIICDPVTFNFRFNGFHENETFELILLLLKLGITASFGAGYESTERKASKYSRAYLLLQEQVPSMETWIKESAQWLFTFLSLFLRHQVAEAFITSVATATAPPSWWGGMDILQNREGSNS